MTGLPRRRLLALFLRAALRRPARGLLVVVGLVAMSLASTASLVAADSLERLFVADAEAQWPDVDVEVTSATGAVFGQGLGTQVARRGEALVEAAATRLVLPVVPRAGARSEPLARLLGVTPSEQVTGLPTALAGTTDPQQLGPDDVVVNERLAERLDIGVGDRMDLVVAVPEVVHRDALGRETGRSPPRAAVWAVEVAGVAADERVADLGRTANVLARLDQVQRVTGLDGRISALHLTTRAGGDEAAEALVDAVRPATAQFGLRAVAAREDALESARDEGGMFRGILLTLALLVAGASVAVTVQLLVLLGQERSPELAALRALGVRRRAVAQLLAAEGVVYAVVAALVGAALGVPLASLLAGALADHFAAITAGRGREQVELVLTARPATVATALLLVLTAGALAATAAARRLAGQPVDAALRGAAGGPSLDLPARRPGRVLGAGLFLAGAGTTATVAGDLLRFAGLSLLLTAGWLTLRRRAADRATLDRRAAGLALLWCLGAPALLADVEQGVQTGFGLLAVAGALSVAAAVVLCTASFRRLTGAVRSYAPRGRAQLALRVAGAYGQARRDRTATIGCSVGVVTFMVAALAVLGSTTDLPARVQGGGWDVVGTAVAPLDRAALAATGAERLVLTSSAVLPEEAYRVVPDGADDGGAGVPYPVRLLRLDEVLPNASRHRLAAALPGFHTAAQALQAVGVDPGTAVVDRYALPQGAQPGDDVVLRTSRGPRTFRLLAVLDTYVLQGVVVSSAAYGSVVPATGDTFVLASVPEGATAEELAADLTAAGADRGLVVEPVATVAADVTRTNRVFTDVFGLMLLAGLVVALAAAAVLVSRAGRERRADLGVLRAMGARRRTVVLALTAEPLLAGSVGLVVGAATGVVVLRLLFAVGYPDLPFRLAWGQLGLAVAVVAAVLGAGCLLSALHAARTDPAVALRDLG